MTFKTFTRLGLLFCGCLKRRTSCSDDLKYVLCYFLMHQSHMSLLLMIQNVIDQNDLNILLLVNVVLNNVALSKFPQQNFHEVL